jgi:hypothetical protein
MESTARGLLKVDEIEYGQCSLPALGISRRKARLPRIRCHQGIATEERGSQQLLGCLNLAELTLAAR